MAEEIGNMVDKIYGFLMRDLSYVFGGSLLLASVKYACDGRLGSLKDAIDYVSQGPIKFIIFLGVSYFIGVVILHITELARITNTKVQAPGDYDSEELLMVDVYAEYGMEAIRRLERIIYLKSFGAAVSSASLFSLLISLYPLLTHHKTSNFIISAILLVLTVSLGIVNRSKRGRQEDILKHFADRLRAPRNGP